MRWVPIICAITSWLTLVRPLPGFNGSRRTHPRPASNTTLPLDQFNANIHVFIIQKHCSRHQEYWQVHQEWVSALNLQLQHSLAYRVRFDSVATLSFRTRSNICIYLYKCSLFRIPFPIHTPSRRHRAIAPRRFHATDRIGALSIGSTSNVTFEFTTFEDYITSNGNINGNGNTQTNNKGAEIFYKFLSSLLSW